MKNNNFPMKNNNFPMKNNNFPIKNNQPFSNEKQPFSYEKQQFSHEKEPFSYMSIPFFGTDSPISTAPLRVAPRLQDATERRAVQDGRREALVAELRKAGPGGGRLRR
jgi:hypothetical protein